MEALNVANIPYHDDFHCRLTRNKYIPFTDDDFIYLADYVMHRRYIYREEVQEDPDMAALFEVSKTISNVYRTLSHTFNFVMVEGRLDVEQKQVLFSGKLGRTRFQQQTNFNPLVTNTRKLLDINVEFHITKDEGDYYSVNLVSDGVVVAAYRYDRHDSRILSFDMNFPNPAHLVGHLVNDVFGTVSPEIMLCSEYTETDR